MDRNDQVGKVKHTTLCKLNLWPYTHRDANERLSTFYVGHTLHITLQMPWMINDNLAAPQQNAF